MPSRVVRSDPCARRWFRSNAAGSSRRERRHNCPRSDRRGEIPLKGRDPRSSPLALLTEPVAAAVRAALAVGGTERSRQTAGGLTRRRAHGIRAVGAVRAVVVDAVRAVLNRAERAVESAVRAPLPRLAQGVPAAERARRDRDGRAALPHAAAARVGAGHGIRARAVPAAVARRGLPALAPIAVGRAGEAILAIAGLAHAVPAHGPARASGDA